MLKHYHHDCTFVTVLCLGLSLPILGQAVLLLPQTQPAPTERIVKLNVLVTDERNRPVMDVKQEEFRILEDGSPKTVSYFSKDELPLDYCIVLDNSGSVRKLGAQLIDAAHIIVTENKPGDETALIEFKDQAELLEEFTSSKDLILTALDTLRGWATRRTAIVDAVYLAAKYVTEYNPVDHISRRALIVVSDGDDNDSYYRLDELRKALRKSDVQAFAIGYDTNEVAKTKGKKRQQRAIELLTEIAKETGGRAYFPKSEVELQEVASRILRELRTQYVIGYKSARGGKKDSYHTLGVSVAAAPGRDKRTATTRVGYIDDPKK